MNKNTQQPLDVLQSNHFKLYLMIRPQGTKLGAKKKLSLFVDSLHLEELK